MIDVRELRRTLVDHEDPTPDTSGIVEAARLGAARRRRHHRIAYTAVVAAGLALTVAVTPAVIGQLHRGHTAAPGGSGQLRPFLVTVDIAPGHGFTKPEYGVLGTVQYMVVRPTATNTRNWLGHVAVHDPGTFDPAPLRHGQQVTVQGRPAYLVTDFAYNIKLTKIQTTVPGPAVVWQDASGAWVIVYFEHPEGNPDPTHNLLAIADAVRIGPPRKLLAPYHLTYLPAGLTGAYASDSDSVPSEADSYVALGGPPLQDGPVLPRTLLTAPYPHPASEDPALEIEAVPHRDTGIGLPGPPTRIAGLDTWYVTTGVHDLFGVPAQGSALVVSTAKCWVEFYVKDRNQIRYDELKRIVEGARFGDCTAPGTWTPPLP